MPQGNKLTLVLTPHDNPYYAGELTPLPTLTIEERTAGCTIGFEMSIRVLQQV